MLKKQYAIKKKFVDGKYQYYPVHSYIGLIWSYFYVSVTRDPLEPYSSDIERTLTYKVCFDDLEEAKAYIGKIIFNKKTSEEQQELLIKYSLEELTE